MPLIQCHRDVAGQQVGDQESDDGYKQQGQNKEREPV